ncbi:MAG TPA: bifunctional metallophosphatase/5'-nucleotidase, partial [Rubrivivax sp.]|nr:bifunctional metallophosphatase/5'-nucleotidase [Rubrivivax sp.]
CPQPLPRALCRMLLAAMLAALPWVQALAARLDLRLLETTDLHMHLLAWDYYQDKPSDEFGLARTASLIKAARAEVRNSLYFDNGDLLQGSPLGDWVARVRPLPAG